MPSGLDHGYGAHFIKMYYGDDNLELSPKVNDFKYVYSEEEDDVATIEIQVDNRKEADKPYYQEKAQLNIMWGYIGGEISDVRKVFIQEIAWKYDEDKITATITATEKAVSLKFEDSNEVYHNSSMIGVANTIAKRHGLKAYIEEDTAPGPEFILPLSTGVYRDLSTYLKKNREALSQRGLNDINKFAKEHPAENRKIINDALTRAVEQEKVRKKDPTGIIGKLKSIKLYDNIPQAGMTDKQILKKLGAKENDGPYIIDTRDDELIIKKRNFNQTPYKSYTYGGDEGSFTNFKPMSKSRRHKANATNRSFTSFNPFNKTFSQGNASAQMDENETLSKFKAMYKFYKSVQKAGGGKLAVKNVVRGVYNPFFNKNNAESKSDNTIVNAQQLRLVPFTVDDKLTVLSRALDSYEKMTNNNTYDPTNTNAVDALNAANNARRASELKLNPANATFYGDPNLKVGKLITLLGMAEKFVGNYYIIKATHHLEKGFTTELELVRQGYNIKASPDHHKVTGSINTEKGPEYYNRLSKPVKKKTNPK